MQISVHTAGAAVSAHMSRESLLRNKYPFRRGCLPLLFSVNKYKHYLSIADKYYALTRGSKIDIKKLLWPAHMPPAFQLSARFPATTIHKCACRRYLPYIFPDIGSETAFPSVNLFWGRSSRSGNKTALHSWPACLSRAAGTITHPPCNSIIRKLRFSMTIQEDNRSWTNTLAVALLPLCAPR